MATPRKTPYPFWFTEALHRALRKPEVNISCDSPREAEALRGRYYAYRKMARAHLRARPSYIEELNSLSFSIVLGPPTFLKIQKEPAQ